MLSDEEKNSMELDIEAKYVGRTEKEFLNNITYAECLYILDTKNKYCDDIKNLSLLKIVDIVNEQSKEIEHQKLKRANQRNELAILNAKQIEFNKLVNTVNSYKGQFKRQEKEIEELKEIYQTGYVNGCVSKVYEINKKWKDKIKAKIEEVDYKMIAHQDVREAIKQVLQSLLEKE